MGMTSSKNQSLILPVNLPRAPPLTPKETEESAVSVCHHMTTLLASSDREVRQTARQVLAQMTNAAATSHLLDGVTSHHLQDRTTTHLQDRATSHLLDKTTTHLQDRTTSLKSPSFQSTDIRYGSNAGGGDSIGQTLGSRNNNWDVPVKIGRSSWDPQTNGGFCSSISSLQVKEVLSGSKNGKSARVMMKKMKKMDDDDLMAPVEVTSAATAGAMNQEFLVRGQKLFETHGAKTELWMPEEETFLGKAHLATIICGMLNSPSGGTIYIGVHEDGTVWGLDLDRSGRDLLRRNLAKVMKDKIGPTVLCPSEVTIHFVPVDCGEGNMTTVVVVNITAFPACGIVWETPRIYQARCLSVVELEGSYIRTEGVSSTLNLKMKPMDLLKEQKKMLNM